MVARLRDPALALAEPLAAGLGPSLQPGQGPPRSSGPRSPALLPGGCCCLTVTAAPRRERDRQEPRCSCDHVVAVTVSWL